MNKYSYNQDGALFLRVYIQPRASKDEIVGIHDDKLKIRLTAPAIEDKANQALIKFIAKKFKVVKSAIQIVGGEHSRTKLIRIENSSVETQHLASLL